jgi:hypothetical protein
MTTLTAAASAAPARSTALGRILAVTRLHFANRYTVFVVPLMVMGAILVLNIAIWFIIWSNVGAKDRADVSEGFSYSGASFWIFVYMMVLAIQAIALTFPFAQGFSVTRRDFYLGTAVAFTSLSLAWALLLSVLAALEDATGGWGMNGRMFTSVYFGEGTLSRFFVYFGLFMFMFFLGSTIAALWVRFRVTGMLLFFGTLGLILIGLVALFTYTRSWNVVGTFFATNGQVGVVAWSFILTAIAAVTGFFILRRAVPRS